MSFHGFLLVDKPVGVTSFHIVSRLRKLTQEKRIGFSGTLDPFASGLLIVGIGRLFTRHLDTFTNMRKTYVATMKLGESTDTLDCKGTVTEIRPISKSFDDISHEIRAAFGQFLGPITQQIPAFSAKKISGQPMYKLARKGKEMTLPFKSVEIDALTALEATDPFFTYEITCSKGTYVRQMSVDLAAAVGELAYTDQLRRTVVGPYKVEDALKLDDFSIESITTHVFQDLPTQEFAS